MRIGLGLPQRSAMDLRRDVAHVASTAEEAGFDSLWVFERLVYPTSPRQDMYDIPGLPWNEAYRDVVDPLAVLTVAGAATERVRLGASVLVAALHDPVVLAKSLATIDHLSGGGRLIAGLGTGWMIDEFEAVGTDRSRRGADLDELLQVLSAAWGPDPVSHRGRNAVLSEVVVSPKPRTRIPIMLGGGFAHPAAQRRIARWADGWLATSLNGAQTMALAATLRDARAREGRSELPFEVINRANVALTDDPLDGERPAFVGSFDQIVSDIAENARAGVDELIVELNLQERCDDGEWLLQTALELKAAATEAAAT